MGAFRGAFRTCSIQLLGRIGIFLRCEFRKGSGSTYANAEFYGRPHELRNSGGANLQIKWRNAGPVMRRKPVIFDGAVLYDGRRNFAARYSNVPHCVTS